MTESEAANIEQSPGDRSCESADQSVTELFFHGTREDLRPGDVVAPGSPPGATGDEADASLTYMSPDLDAAIWSAELAQGDGPPRVYIVEAGGPIEDASELIAENAPRHPFMSWRSNGEVRVKSEVRNWTWYHGTRASLKAGDMLLPGSDPNYGQTLSHVYLTRTLDAAKWGAELALGNGPQRIYLVEPTGPLEVL